MEQKKKCAVCGTKIQSNIVMKWLRFDDNVVFHVCSMCAESGKVNEHSVKILETKKYTTVDRNFKVSEKDKKIREQHKKNK